MQQLDYKLVIITREDLKLSSGKLAVQVAHASVTCAMECRQKHAKWYNHWYREGQKKVVVTTSNLVELKKLEKKAHQNDLIACMIQDAGLTEIPEGTITCLGIGPGPNDKIDRITGQLSLL